jgi:hypothetical protein
MKIYEGLEVKLHIFLITESDRGKCQLHILAALSLGKNTMAPIEEEGTATL